MEFSNQVSTYFVKQTHFKKRASNIYKIQGLNLNFFEPSEKQNKMLSYQLEIDNVVISQTAFGKTCGQKSTLTVACIVKPQKDTRKDNLITILSLSNIIHAVWQYRLWSFQTGDTKIERFLPKNQHTQRKSMNFEYWCSGENLTFKSLVFLLISNLTNGLRLHQFLGTCLPQQFYSLKTDANGVHQ